MPQHFDPAAYGPALAEAIGDEPAMPLGAGAPDRPMRPVLEALTVDAAFGDRPVVDPGMASCCLAGVWLLHGFLDEAHTLCQDVPTATGSYWHGIVHRREGDYGNAGYWFRRAGDHPVGAAVASAAAERPETVELALGGRWDPIGLVERVRDAVRSGGAATEPLVALQRAEWRALFDFCWRRAIDG